MQAFSIPSDSMQNTLQQGDRVLVDKLTPWFGSEPERGEVVVFHDPDNWLAGEPTPDPNAVQTFLSWIGLMPSAEEKDLIKRVIGVGGDTVDCEGTGPLKVNGKALNERRTSTRATPRAARTTRAASSRSRSRRATSGSWATTGRTRATPATTSRTRTTAWSR